MKVEASATVISIGGSACGDGKSSGESAGEHQHAEGIGHGNSTLEII